MEWSYDGLAPACGPAPLKEVLQGTGQMQISPCMVSPTWLQPTPGRIWFHTFGDNRGRKIPTLYVSPFDLGFAFLNHNQKSSKAVKLEMLSDPVLSDTKPLNSKQIRPFLSCLLNPSS